MRTFYDAFKLEMQFILRSVNSKPDGPSQTIFHFKTDFRELWQVLCKWNFFNYNFRVKGKLKFLKGNYKRIPIRVKQNEKAYTLEKPRRSGAIPALIHQIHQSYHHQKNVSEKSGTKSITDFPETFC